MTVADLIKALAALPADLPVVLLDRDRGGFHTVVVLDHVKGNCPFMDDGDRKDGPFVILDHR